MIRKTSHAIAAIALVLSAATFSAPPVRAQASHEIIPLYTGAAPGSEKWTQKEGSYTSDGTRFKPAYPDVKVWNVVKPTLEVYKPAPGKANGTAVIVAPGGGFFMLSYRMEGTAVAQYLADRGITAFVLKYRLSQMPDGLDDFRKAQRQRMSDDNAPVAAADRPAAPDDSAVREMGVADGKQAMKIVRGRAKEFGIDANRVGFIGFSAGGSVAGGVTVGSAPADRPNFVGIIYSGVTGTIPKDAPPAFMAVAADDPGSVRMPDLFTRWRAAGAQAEVHIYSKGGHGFGMAKQGIPVDGWADSFYAWMVQQGFVPSDKSAG